MKKLVAFLFIVLVLFSIYNDFNHGSLPAAVHDDNIKVEPVSIQENNVQQENIPYFEKEILPGDTVLSVLEEELNEPIPVPITEVVTDFEELNEGIKPEDIKFGKSYKFPKYGSQQ
jgi:hypothetical protein